MTIRPTPTQRIVLERPRRATVDLDVSELYDGAALLIAHGYRIALIAGHDDGDGSLRVVYLFVDGPPDQRVELQVRVSTDEPRLASLANFSFPAGRFERELQDLFGLEPVGHPQPRSLVRHQHWDAQWFPHRKDAGVQPDMIHDAAPYPFATIEGTGIYEIPVGPVHAGVIEPGHFRFWVVGETIVKMKARLWFVHKGIERLFEGRDETAALALSERVSGDSAIGHSLAHCLAVEEALGVEVSARTGELRAVLLELERLYNHVADVGALCNDAGFSLANARALTLRERLLRLNERVSGHRLLRGALGYGAVNLQSLPRPEELHEVATQFREIVDLARANTILMDRFRGTGVLNQVQARDIGVLGVTARASGLNFDARHAHPFFDTDASFQAVTRDGGDVLSRFEVRCDEVEASLTLLGDLISREGSLTVTSTESVTPHEGHGTGIVEGWRGAVVHRVEFSSSGELSRVKIVDPSFPTWPALAIALSDTIVPDFPLVNKSFNLSYAGNDL
ncbi:MAG TPA: NADH-quinone oxidoreductase subunit C [Acidimicrobiales bacterium]